MVKKEKLPFKIKDRVIIVNVPDPLLEGLKGKIQGPLIAGKHLIQLDQGIKKNVLVYNIEHDE